MLTFFRVSSDEYTVIFTVNATHVLKLLGEEYPFTFEGEMAAVVGQSQFCAWHPRICTGKGAGITYFPVILTELRACEALLGTALEKISRNCDGPLPFAYPTQSNFTGAPQHPLEWIATARAQGLRAAIKTQFTSIVTVFNDCYSTIEKYDVQSMEVP